MLGRPPGVRVAGGRTKAGPFVSERPRIAMSWPCRRKTAPKVGPTMETRTLNILQELTDPVPKSPTFWDRSLGIWLLYNSRSMYFSAMLENAQDDLGKDCPNSTARQSLYQFARSARRSRALLSCGVFWNLQDNARTVADDRGMRILDFFRLERQPSCAAFGDLWFVASALRDEIVDTLERSVNAEFAALVPPSGYGAVGATGSATSYTFCGAPSIGVSSIPPAEVPTFDFSVDQYAHVHTGRHSDEDWRAPACVSSCHSRLVTAVSGVDMIEEGWASALQSPASGVQAVIHDGLVPLSSSRCFAFRELDTDETGGLDNSSPEGVSSQRTSDSCEKENLKQKSSGTLPMTPRDPSDASASNATTTCGRAAGGCLRLGRRSDVDTLGAGLSCSSGQQEETCDGSGSKFTDVERHSEAFHGRLQAKVEDMESRLAVSQGDFSGTEKSLHAEVDRLLAALDQEIEGRAVENIRADRVTREMEARQKHFAKKMDQHILMKARCKKGLARYQFHTEPVSKYGLGNVPPQQTGPNCYSLGARAQAGPDAVNNVQVEVRAGLGREVDCPFVAGKNKTRHDARGKKGIDTGFIGKGRDGASTMTAATLGSTGSITQIQKNENKLPVVDCSHPKLFDVASIGSNVCQPFNNGGWHSDEWLQASFGRSSPGIDGRATPAKREAHVPRAMTTADDIKGAPPKRAAFVSFNDNALSLNTAGRPNIIARASLKRPRPEFRDIATVVEMVPKDASVMERTPAVTGDGGWKCAGLGAGGVLNMALNNKLAITNRSETSYSCHHVPGEMGRYLKRTGPSVFEDGNAIAARRMMHRGVTAKVEYSSTSRATAPANGSRQFRELGRTRCNVSGGFRVEEEDTRVASTPALDPFTDMGEGTGRFGLGACGLGDLEIAGFLGSGQFGHVTAVRKKGGVRAGETFALKAISKEFIVETGHVNSVKGEKRALELFDHPFVLKLYCTLQDDDCLFFLTELLQGGDLFRVIEESASGFDSGRLPAPHTRFYSVVVADALAYMHSKDIAYRDLKPENVMVDSEGYLRIVDMGFAKKIAVFAIDNDGRNFVSERSNSLVGTPEYMAPEIYARAGHDQSVDLWAFGVLIFEMVEGRTPFDPLECGPLPGTPEYKMQVESNVFDVEEMGVKFSSTFDIKTGGPNCRDLISRLLAFTPEERLGYRGGRMDDVKQHAWYDGMDWEALRGKRLRAPWVPKEFGTLAAEGSKIIDRKYTGDQGIFAGF